MSGDEQKTPVMGGEKTPLEPHDDRLAPSFPMSSKGSLPPIREVAAHFGIGGETPFVMLREHAPVESDLDWARDVDGIPCGLPPLDENALRQAGDTPHSSMPTPRSGGPDAPETRGEAPVAQPLQLALAALGGGIVGAALTAFFLS